jgi:transposase
MNDSEAAMMDKGYDGITADYPDKKLYLPFKARRNHPLAEEQKAYNRFLYKYRIVVEHTMAQLNKFQILVQRFRHQLAKRYAIFCIVASLVNRRIQLHLEKLRPGFVRLLLSCITCQFYYCATYVFGYLHSVI